ncbi:ice-binding protein [Ramaria rubella]|nr:ice-binding protein [Ramaria rubella]
MTFDLSVSLIFLGVLALSSCAVALGPAPVNLGTAANFAILGKSGISTVPSSAITGDIGVSPVAAIALTGFSLTMSPNGTSATSSQVIGNVFSASYMSPTPSVLTTAISDMGTAHTDANGRVNPDHTNLESGILSGLNLAPGLYTFSTGVSIPTSITLSGNASDTWIFQIAGTLTMAAAQSVILSGGALPQNIVWVVTGFVSLGVTAHFEGIILGATSITLDTDASINGRIFSQTAVSLQMATVTSP